MRGRELGMEVGGNLLAYHVVGFGFLAHNQLAHQWHNPPTTPRPNPKVFGNLVPLLSNSGSGRKFPKPKYSRDLLTLIPYQS